MMKKIICLLLTLCCFMNTFNVPMKAKEESKTMYLPIKCLNDKSTNTYEVIIKDNHIYMEAHDFMNMIQYKKIDLHTDKDKGELIYLQKNELNYDFDVFAEITKDKVTTNFGSYDYSGFMVIEDEENQQKLYYLDLYELMNCLKIKAMVSNDTMLITLPQYTIADFLMKDFSNYSYLFVQPTDLLEIGEGKISSSLYDSLIIMVNNFDMKLFVPGWGTSEIEDELYMKALQALNQNDDVFYQKESQEKITETLKENGLSELVASGDDLANILSVSGESIDTIGDIIDEASRLTKSGDEMLSDYLEMVNWNEKTFDGFIELRAFAKYGNELSNVLSISDVFVSGYEVYSRAKNWNENTLNDLDNLRNIDTKKYAKGKGIAKEIKQNADKAYEESKKQLEAAFEAGVTEFYSVLAEEGMGLIPIGGQMMQLTTLVVNAGVAIARLNDNWAKEMDRAELSAMVNNLIKLSLVSEVEAQYQYHMTNPLWIEKTDAEQFISKARTAVKTNMRCWSYLYYLRNTSQKETEYRKEQAKDKVTKLAVILELLDAAEKTLYVCDEKETVLCDRDEINKILKDSKLDKEKYYSGLYDIIQKILNENNFSDEETLTGFRGNNFDYMMYAISYLNLIDFNNDGIEECIITYSLEDYSYSYKTIIYSYDNDKGEIINLFEKMGGYYLASNGQYHGLCLIKNENNEHFMKFRKVTGSGPFAYEDEIYTLKNGEFKVIEKLITYGVHNVHGVDIKFFVNDKEVTIAEFNDREKYWDKECEMKYIPLVVLKSERELIKQVYDNVCEIYDILLEAKH